MKNRHIPKIISENIKKRHFFQCAWCCTGLFDRHHIKEFSEGGEHTEENLILLCPNCHRKVHNNEIDVKELKKRKSTHLRNDRLQGNFVTDFNKLRIKVGGVTYENSNIPLTILKFKDQPIIFAKIENASLLLDVQFYNSQSKLIFWMSKNDYWSDSSFKITSSNNFLEIRNTQDNNLFLKIKKQNENLLTLEASFYLGGEKYVFDEDKTNIGRRMMMKGVIIKNCNVGLLIE
jgi:HNH endonuclease